MEKSAESLMRDYVYKMEEYWGGNYRQCKKNLGRLQRIKEYYDYSTPQAVSFLSKISEERLSEKCNTIYISNFGSSGSHLYQHILHMTVSSIPLGEVYRPSFLDDHIKELDHLERNKFVEMYHLSNAMEPWAIPGRGIIINTAHKANIKEFGGFSRYYKTGLVVRNPVDLVISRTFRKSEYRSYLGFENEEDEQYLDLNIKKAHTFYKTALQCCFDEYLRFEDLFKDEKSRDFASRILSKLIGREEYFRGIRASLDGSIVNGNETNKFEGPPVKVDDRHWDKARHGLKDIFMRLNCRLIELGYEAYK